MVKLIIALCCLNLFDIVEDMKNCYGCYFKPTFMIKKL